MLYIGRQCKIHEALYHFYNEWEVGIERNHSPLVIDSMKAIGRILLEEGQFRDAELFYREAYNRYEEFKSMENAGQREENQEDDLLDEYWAMAGISAGHGLWTRFVGLVRSETPFNNYRLVEWKSNRRSFPRDKLVKHKPALIRDELKLANANRWMKRDVEAQEELRSFTTLKTPEELLTDWVHTHEDEEYKFQHDIDVENNHAKIKGESLDHRRISQDGTNAVSRMSRRISGLPEYEADENEEEEEYEDEEEEENIEEDGYEEEDEEEHSSNDEFETEEIPLIHAVNSSEFSSADEEDNTEHHSITEPEHDAINTKKTVDFPHDLNTPADNRHHHDALKKRNQPSQSSEKSTDNKPSILKHSSKNSL
jgi:hypothetical protein